MHSHDLSAWRHDRVTDCHCWSIGQGIHAAGIAVVSDAPREPEHYRSLLPASPGIVHATIEVNRCPDHAGGR